ncbi:ABC transporter permease [Microvirga pudoricolor]|uniref:ABC transporter permease n=1 Tax=Microvirga pudoricolor TaxID=2778729 RepID=UPI0019529AD6|nr:ABC transporter permease subunit [Microvirga pudoricolor]MBM6594880.1 ABC transporter permease subunit [Microvirga pudoricolor]
MRRAGPGRDRAQARDARLRVALPLVVCIAGLLAWEAYVRLAAVPPYILPAPTLIAATLVTDRHILLASWLVTLETALLGLGLAVLGGVALAVALSLSRIVEYAVYPLAVALQVTPVVAVAPLLLIYLPESVAVLACAFVVAFFPILSNTMLGLQSVDRNLLELFALYGQPVGRSTAAARFRARAKALWHLRRPAALPSFLAGLRIAGGLSLIGAVVAEMAAGSAGASSGLAYRIIESQYRLNIPRLFAALVLLITTGILIYLLTSAVSHRLLRRWHPSALTPER